MLLKLQKFTQVKALNLHRLNYKIIIIKLLVLSLISTFNAQNPYFKRLSSEMRFPSEVVYDIHQDKAGFIWFATDIGLIQYDGKVFKTFPVNVVNGKAVSNIMESANGVIWCQNFSGRFYATRNDSLIYQPKISIFSNYALANILNDTILVSCTANGVSLFNTITGQQKLLQLSETNFRPAMQFNHSEYLLQTQDKLIAINAKGVISTKAFPMQMQTFYTFEFNDQKLGLTKSNPIQLQINTKDNILSLEPLLKDVLIQNVCALPRQRFAIMSTSGFYILDKQFKLSQHYFPEENVSSILEDREGNTWVSTLNRGVLFIPNLGIRQFLTDYFITATSAINNSSFLIGTYNNELLKVNAPHYTLQSLQKNKVIHQITSIYYNKTKSEIMYANPFLNQWQNGKNTSLLNVSINEIKRLDSTHYLLSEGGGTSIYPVMEGDAWYRNSPFINSDVYLNKRLALGKTFVRVKSSENIGDTIFSVGSTGLIKHFNGQTAEVLFNKTSIQAIKIQKQNDSLFIATIDKGILLYVKGQLHSFFNWKEDKRLYDIITFRIQNHHLFLLHKNGIDVIGMDGKIRQSLLLSNGLSGVSLTDFLIRNDTIIGINANGILEIPLKSAFEVNYTPLLHINQVLVNQMPYPINEPLVLTPQQNEIEVLFSLLDFKGQASSKVFYSINNGVWKEVSGSSLQLTALQPEQYNLRFKAITIRGTESAITSIYFTINAPFYKTWWFILLMAIFVLSILFGLFRIRLKAAERKTTLLAEKSALEKALYQSTLSGIKSQMNPHFIFNALNTIQSYIYLNDKKSAADYLVQFSELTRLILEMSNKEKVTLYEELKALKLYLDLEKMRFEDDFNFELSKNELDQDALLIPSMLIQPYVENAIKHGLLHKKGAKRLKINFELKQNVLLVNIEDNGIGIEASKQLQAFRGKKHESFATQANQKRFELLNQASLYNIGVTIINLENTMQQSIGTKVTLSIPV